MQENSALPYKQDEESPALLASFIQIRPTGIHVQQQQG